MTTTIQWTDVTWNPVTGCTKVSEGCRNCYAERVSKRTFAGHMVGIPETGGQDERPRRFTDVRCHPERLDAPLRWRKPRRVFVNSMSDLFHEDVPDEFIDQVFAVMALAQKHEFQVLTKRPQRMRQYLTDGIPGGWSRWDRWEHASRREPIAAGPSWFLDLTHSEHWPLPNVQLGVSVEDQKTADERIPILLDTPAALRFVSYEPALGPVDFSKTHSHGPVPSEIDWLIVGGESGPKARPCDVAWIRSAVVQCKAAGVPCFVKQDSGPRPGMQGRIPDDLWIKEFPRA